MRKLRVECGSREQKISERAIQLKKWITFLLAVSVFIGFGSVSPVLNVQATSPDADGVIWLTGNYEQVWPFKEGLAAVYKDGYLGFVDKTGKEVIPLKYNSERIAISYKSGLYPDISFKDGMALVNEYDNETGFKYGFVDRKGNVVIPFDYSAGLEFSEGLAAVKKDGKWGYIDKTGKEIIPYIFDNAKSFSEGLAPVEIDRLWGYIDKTGELVLPQKYFDNARGFSEGLAAVNRYYFTVGFIDKTGKEIVEPKYKYYIWGFKDGLACVRNDKYGLIDNTGKEIAPLEYDYIREFSEGLVAVEKDGKWGYLDKTGKVKIPIIYESVGAAFSEGLTDFRVNNLVGYMDKTGKVIIPPKYNIAGNFSEGLAAVFIGDYNNGYKCGYIDRTGKLIVPMKYDHTYAFTFSEGVVWVKKDGRWGIMSNPLIKDSTANGTKYSAYSNANPIFRSELDKAESLRITTDALIWNDLTTPITREEFAELAVKYYEMVTGKKAEPHPTKRFTDCNNPEVLKAVNLNITHGVGDSTKFEPESFLLRQQMAAMITRTIQACYEGLTLDVEGVPDFNDQKLIASYATDSTKFMAKYKITVGDGNGNFSPNNYCTREQAIVFLVRAYQNKDQYKN